jgi:crotonobetainyl-CoA:carnitine CoA-transferase CaiB-like acyl-CoA transferase
MPGPMDGVRVVELGIWVAGPAAGGILADWGADVIKIEPPKGDPARTFSRMLGGDLPTNPVFELDNRSKRSVVLDLQTEQGRATALELVATADVFLTNVRVETLRHFGFDPDTLRAMFPRLVYAIVTGYGINGPDADRPAYDIAAYWARAGVAASLTPPGADLPFQRGGMGDHTVGMTAAAMISAALFAREHTGEGDFVSTSLLRRRTPKPSLILLPSAPSGRLDREPAGGRVQGLPRRARQRCLPAISCRTGPIAALNCSGLSEGAK